MKNSKLNGLSLWSVGLTVLLSAITRCNSEWAVGRIKCLLNIILTYLDCFHALDKTMPGMTEFIQILFCCQLKS